MSTSAHIQSHAQYFCGGRASLANINTLDVILLFEVARGWTASVEMVGLKK